MKSKAFLFLLLIGLAGCNQLPKVGSADSARLAKDSQSQIDSPKQELTSELLFDYLLAETALQRENIDVAIQSYSRLAKNTGSPNR